MTVKTRRDSAHIEPQLRLLHQRHRQGIDETGYRGLRRDGRRPVGDGLLDKLAAVMHFARYRQKQVPGAHLAAVQLQAADQRVAAGAGGPAQQFGQGHGPGGGSAGCHHHTGPPAAEAAAAAASAAVSVGATFSRRSTPWVTVENTGAATAPPP